MNAEIIARLEASFSEDMVPGEEVIAMMKDQNRLMLDLADAAGFKLPKRVRRGLEEIASPPEED